MKPIHLISAAISGCCPLLAGCAAPQSPAPVSSTQMTADWKAGEYAVSFRAGPMVESELRSYSSYEVSRNTGAGVPKTVAVESGFSTASFRGSYIIRLDECVTLFTSRSGKTLLIREIVPHETSPCMNWILVRGVKENLVRDYLDLPTYSDGPDHLVGEAPTITRVSEQEISFRYSDGTKRTVTVKDVMKKEQRPDFPG